MYSVEFGVKLKSPAGMSGSEPARPWQRWPTSAAKVTIADRTVTVEGGKNRLQFTHRPEVTVKIDDAGKNVLVERKENTRQARALHGLTRALIANMVEGVTKGFTRELEINGVGWGAKLQGKQVVLNVGFAQPRFVNIPDGVSVEVNGNKVKVTGADKQQVGQTAAAIRATRKPEPYNGKGVKYVEEQIIRKQGKAFAGGG